ncbi:hypothetical protein UCRPC4_g05270 [Phaeomoniella chlamydospora]|uniref:S-adenosylmethionine-dependent methyltransferase-like protein n=1 Tax=Phaeomoniella chlamydospora TaxID=158046 RepID=A0A0G2E6T8_PHACM|nr:hypothetical protein UCRPC4_g05270 [Phaeomoniella chlamydospora]
MTHPTILSQINWVNITSPPAFRSSQASIEPEATSYPPEIPEPDEKENKRSKRSYFGIQSSVKESAPKLLGRSVSVRKRALPQPPIDTTHPAHRQQGSQSAIEPSSYSDVQGLQGRIAPAGQANFQPNPGQERIPDYTALREYKRAQGSFHRSKESVQEIALERPESQASTPTGADPSKRPHHGLEQIRPPAYTSNSSSQRPDGSQQPLANENGRGTPPLSNKGREDLSILDPSSLLAKHEELLAKYSKVKRYYFEKDAQVQQLQNIVAHQRLSMNNTALDDNEYQARFNRLDGAINNFAFNIRKDWKAVPPWLQAVVNKDAASVGTKEMTAVGRACITRWLVDEIFDRFFHPGLEPTLSSQLKIIEKNIRRSMMSKATSEEAQREDHSVKLSNWRLTTMEGLHEVLSSAQSQEYRTQLTSTLIGKLTASLEMNLKDPPPPGLEVGIGGIVELAVGIASNIPMESRDVSVEYFMPGAPIIEEYMKLETALPPLTNPGATNDFLLGNINDQTDRASTNSASTDSSPEKEQFLEGDSISPRRDSLAGISRDPREKKKSIFGGLVNKKAVSGDNNGTQSRGTASSAADRDRELARERENADRVAASERERRIRFAAFAAVEVTGRGKEGGNVLVKAPCFTYSERVPAQREGSM